MIILLGATGYVGQAFARELRRRGERFIPLSRAAFDYSTFELLFDYVRKLQPDFLINAEDCGRVPTEAESDPDRLEMLQINTLLPQTVSRVCVMLSTPWGHVSSGSIYSGARVFENCRIRVEKDLCRAEGRRRFGTLRETCVGFSEEDEPNCCFRHPPCGFYSGTKALAEEALRKDTQSYVWRLRLPFNERHDAGNWLSLFQRGAQLSDGVDSLSHLEDCVRACLDLWERRSPFGIYNVVNPGAVTTREVANMVRSMVDPRRRFKWSKDEGHLGSPSTLVPATNCILDVSKLLKTGVELRPVELALKDAIGKWHPALAARGREPLSEPMALPVGS